jgi:transcriptional regulator with XRE-family HTH domain
MHVKHRLLAWRKKRRLSQRAAAKLAHMSHVAWQSYEDDTSNSCPGVNAALAIQDVTEGEISVEDWREADTAKAMRRARALSKRVPKAKAS